MRKKLVGLVLAIAIVVVTMPIISVNAKTDIQIGDYIQMGAYLGEPILWRCVDKDENGPLMLSDKIISIKPYDAGGSNMNDGSSSHSRANYRVSSGSNYWPDSNIRSWLNSNESAGNVKWLCGNPPDSGHLWGFIDSNGQHGYNAYNFEAGFLTNFKVEELNAIKEVRLKQIVPTAESEYGIYTEGNRTIPYSHSENISNYESMLDEYYYNTYAEYVTDKIFLLDLKQLYEVYQNKHILGSDYHIARLTEAAANNSQYKPNSIIPNGIYQYFLRTPAGSYSSKKSINVDIVSHDGTILCEASAYTPRGIRPAFYLDQSSAVFKSGSGTLENPYTINDSEISVEPIPTPTPDPYADLEPLPTPEFELNKYRANYVIDNNFTYMIEHTYDTPSRLLYNAGIESGLYNTATIWKTITDTVDGLDDVSKILDYQFEEKDIYSAIIFNIFQSSTDYKIVDCINNEITQETKDWVSTVTSNMKNLYNFDVIGSRQLKDMPLEEKEKLKEATERLYKKQHGDAVAESKIASVIGQGIEYAEDVEDYLELMVTYDKIRQLSDATKQVMREMYANCPGSEPALKSALSDCIHVMESSADEFESNIQLTLAGVVGKDIAQYVVDELWDIATDKLMSLHPAAYAFKVAYDTGKFVCNAVFNTDDITEKYFDMGAVVKTKDILDDTYYDLKSKFRKSKTEVDAEIYNNAIDIMYNMLDADCDYAREFVNSVGDSAAGQINSKLGNTSVEETRKSINGIQDSYYTDHESLKISWVFGLEADNYKMYKEYKHLIDESNERIRKKYNINCPVDVYIYNSFGKLEGSVVNNRPYCSDENNITIVVKGDKKTVYFYDDKEYDIRYVGNDTGTMDISVTEYDDEQNETRKVNFNDIALENGTEYTSTDSGSNMSRYVIKDEYSGNIGSDFDSQNAGGRQYTADIKRGYFSSFEMSKQMYPGENSEITAYVPDGYEFVNWTTNTGEDIFDDADSQTTTICMPSRNVEITATIEKRSIAISDVTSSSVTVQTTGCARLADGTIILAAYDNSGALQHVDAKPVSDRVVFSGVNGKNYNIKAMLWDSVNGMMPLVDYAEIMNATISNTPTPTPFNPSEDTADINIGEYLQMGTYYGEPILWRCVDIDENGPLMLSDKIICQKPFDAMTHDNTATGSHSHQRDGAQDTNGSDYWQDSNMRSWLNSDSVAGNVIWLCGNPPIGNAIRYNSGYADEAGFLSNFTDEELEAIKEVKQKSLATYHEYNIGIYDTGSKPYSYNDTNFSHNYDIAYAEYVQDKMFLLDMKQLNAMMDNSSILGEDYYIGEPTEQCVENSEFKVSSLGVNKKWYYWIRSHAPYLGGGTNFIYSSGTIGKSSACNGDVGVRPAFYLNMQIANFKTGLGTTFNPYIIGNPADDTPTPIPTMTPQPTHTVPTAKKNIELGNYIQMGTYYGEPILWRCVDIDENGPLILSDKIIDVKCFDASGSNLQGSHGGYYSERLSSGSNNWADSNIRAWLNSNELSGNTVWPCGNPPYYSDEDGFLRSFTTKEVSLIKSVTQDSLIGEHEYSNMSGYGSAIHEFNSNIESVVTNANTTAYKEHVTDGIFLLDVNQINTVYRNFDDYYIGYPTETVVEKYGPMDASLYSGKPWRTLLRTPNTNEYNNGTCVRAILENGMIVANAVANRTLQGGIRPAFYLTDSSISVTSGLGSEASPYIVERY